jgi:hypothetical protein
MLGIDLSIRDYRNLLIKQAPPYMEFNDADLLNYFSLSGFDYFEKEDVIIVDGVEYNRQEWTLGDFKDALGIAGTGNYDVCVIDIIEKIDSNDNVFVYTNPNYIKYDSMAVIVKKKDDRRNQLITEMNPLLATLDGLLPFWEAMFQSTRQIIDGVPETDAEYMARVVSLLFGASTSLVVIRNVFEKLGLTNFEIIDSNKDETHWNPYSAPFSVNLYLDPDDFDNIDFIHQIFLTISLAGIRLFILCPATDHDCFGLNFGNATDNSDYVVPPPFVPGVGLTGEGFGARFGAFFGN